MASTDTGDRLTRGHRRRQQALRVVLIRELTREWRATFDVNDIDRSYRAFSRSAVPLILDAHATSASHAADYFRSFREAERAPRQHRAQLAAAPGRDRIEYALGYSARITTLRGLRAGKTPADAARGALVRTTGTSTRLASEGGRQTLYEAVRSDPVRPRWQRVTGGDPCAFCAMLAARGGVYRSGANFETHDHCGCELEPVYRDVGPSEQVRAWQEIYDREARGTRDPLKEFRAAYRRQASPA